MLRLILNFCLLAVLLAIFAPQVVRYALAPGFSADPGLFALTVSLLRIQLISAVLFGLGGLIVGILNAHQIFLIPALTPAMYQIGIIFGAVALAPSMGIYGLACGVVIGAALYLLIQIPSLMKQKGTYTFTLGWDNPNARQVISLMGPRLFGVAVVQLNFWVNNILASSMEEGSATSLSYGFSLMLMAQAAIAQSVAIAAMPTFSAQHALGKTDEMRASLAASLRGVILLSLPASVGLILLREPLISLLYQRGEFDAQDVQLVAWALLWYAVGLVGHSVMEVLTRAFEIERRFRLSWWDCLVVAAAQLQSCSVLLTEDLQDGAILGGVTVRNPFVFGVSEYLASYLPRLPSVPAPPRRGRPRGRERPCRASCGSPESPSVHRLGARRLGGRARRVAQRGRAKQLLERRHVRVLHAQDGLEIVHDLLSPALGEELLGPRQVRTRCVERRLCFRHRRGPPGQPPRTRCGRCHRR